MGFFFRCEHENQPAEDLTPTITPGEYVSVLHRVIRGLADAPEPSCHRYRLGLLYLMADRPGPAVKALSGLVQRRPNDGPAHCLLGIAYLNQANFTAAVEHLEIALGLLRREAVTRSGLYGVLRLQCEGALLRLLLVPVYMKLGRTQAARFLLEEGRAL